MQKLTDLQEKFCRAFADIDSETFDNGKESVIVAGYSEATSGSEAWRLLQNIKIAERIEELKVGQVDKSGLSKSKVLCDLENNRRKSMANGTDAGRVNARECSKLEAQITGMLKDVFDVSEEEYKLAESEKAEAAKIARVLNLEAVREAHQVSADTEPAIEPEAVRSLDGG